MGKNIVVEGCQLQFSAGQGTISIAEGQTSTRIKFGGKATYKTLNFTISGYSGGTITDGNGTGSGSIIASSQNVKIEGNKAILEGDTSATITITGTTTIPPAGPVTVTSPDIVTVVSAGQSKAQGV